MNIRAEIVATEIQPSFAQSRQAPWVELLPGLVVLADALVILIAATASFWALVDASSYVRDFYIFAVGFVLLTTLLLLRSADLYTSAAMLAAGRALDLVMTAIATAFLFLMTILYALKVLPLYQTDWLIAFAGASIVGLAASRLVICAVLQTLLRRGRIGRRTAILGTGDHLHRFLSSLRKRAAGLTNVTAVYDTDAPHLSSDLGELHKSGRLQDLVRMARQNAFDDIVIALPDSMGTLRDEAIECLREVPVDVYLAPQLSEFGLRLRPSMHQDELPLFEVWQRPITGWSRILKLAEDYLLAGVALVLLLPVLILIGLAIRLDSRGPILFRQKRLGFNNEAFEIYKFRTMHPEAPSAANGLVIQAKRQDPRVTRVGRLLRRTSLDELPQLLNVLNGTMSLVGPRPHALSHNADFSAVVRGYFGRHKVKPGITGWAQVNGLRGEIDSHDKLVARIKHDVQYAENWSLVFDLRILVVTCFVFLFQRNAY